MADHVMENFEKVTALDTSRQKVRMACVRNCKDDRKSYYSTKKAEEDRNKGI
jgi:hypothetical protein